jgi:1,4-alpha-glucan branching enzyme
MQHSDALYLFNEGRNFQAWRLLGAHAGETGTTFRVWAPNASQVSVVGDFNDWNPAAHPLHSLGASGVWEACVADAPPGSLYRFSLTNRDTGEVLVKADPYARGFELRPGSAAYVVPPSQHAWHDAGWLTRRAGWDWQQAPVNIYEVHAGSWMRHPDGRPYLWRELAARLIPYALDQGYTHLELLPVTEHPLDESWGYQTTGYFAPTSRYGSPDDLRAFVDACHAAGLGVILDWVPGHFPQDAWALARYDGTALYEHEDPRLGLHADWGTHIFNYGRHEVRSFLLSSAHWWLSEFHFDGLRVDAVASMLYLDYSRQPGEWLPNRHGGRENLEAIDFLQALNAMVHGEFPGALTIAEESTAWPQVSRPTWVGGLGFSMKWNMGWMNDSLRHFAREPVHRRWHHNELTFGQVYAYSENYVLPLSHDEVVHGKGSLLGKLPGDDWQRCANLRLLYAWQAAMPGKKLMFMGGEFGQRREWSEARELDWGLLAEPAHAGLRRLSADLNRLYRDRPALHSQDFDPLGFEWIDCNDSEHSVLCWLRWGRDGSHLVVVANFTPVPRHGYRIGVPHGGDYVEILNTDSAHYGGSDLGNGGRLTATGDAWMGRPASLGLTLPPLSVLILQPA